MSEIKIKNISKNFGDFQALDSINLTVKDQEFMALLGPSGCGKTTLLRIIAGLEKADTGEIWIDEKKIDNLPPKERGIAMVFQNYAIFPHMTVFNNIGFGLKMKNFSKSEIKKRVEKNAELMQITHLLDRYSGQISGGQRQRVAVARALAMQPKVILMDEPLSNLDALLRLEMRAEMKNILAESKTTAIYVTHDQVEAMSLADKISLIDKGRIVQCDTPSEIYHNPSTTSVGRFIGNPPMNFLTAKNLGNNNWDIEGFKVSGPTLNKAEIWFSVRPEELEISSNGIEVKIKIIEPLGPNKLLTCYVKKQLFRIIVSNETPVTINQTLKVKPKDKKIRWFDMQTLNALKE
jgi:multiple sugar transport system ATP-binding protein